MTLAELVTALRDAGTRARSDGDELVLTNVEGLSDEVREAAVRLKPELLALVREVERQGPPPAVASSRGGAWAAPGAVDIEREYDSAGNLLSFFGWRTADNRWR